METHADALYDEPFPERRLTEAADVAQTVTTKKKVAIARVQVNIEVNVIPSTERYCEIGLKRTRSECH